jgi:RimJ/RimL family protein N-acetyltransferase
MRFCIRRWYGRVFVTSVAVAAITIRALQPDEWERFRAFRLAALQAAPGVFGTHHAEALQRPEAVWRSTIGGRSNQAFGLFDGDALIGITAVFRWAEDPSGNTAILAGSFIDAAYRGRGLSRLLYDARLAWIRQQRHFTRVVVAHRLSNEASRRANRHYGFVEFGRVPRDWPDGATEDEIFYELTIGAD